MSHDYVPQLGWVLEALDGGSNFSVASHWKVFGVWELGLQ